MMTLAQLAAHIGAQYHGEDKPMLGVSIDTRTIKPGEVFVALKGTHNDGHEFIADAVAKGAGAVLVNYPVDLNVPQIIVNDTCVGLGLMAKVWRSQFNIPVIALTGSCGKTGTKEMIAAILSQKGPTLATQGNLNNFFGVPITLLRLRPEHQFAVIEMGANQLGEIGYLTKIAQPSAALITNINASHLAGFGSFEGVSNEKSDIFLGLANRGVAVVNQDETFSRSWKGKIAANHVVTYGVYNRADVKAENLHFGPEGVTFTLHTPIGNREIAVSLLGEHIVQNAVAAAAAAMAVGASLEDVAQGLANVKPVDGRFKPYRLPNGALLVDDTYNASASAVKSAIQTLSKFAGRRIFVMSNMGELGAYAEQYHADMGRWAVEFGTHHLLLTGNDPALLKKALEACDERAEYFGSKEDLVNKLKAYITPNSMVVIKGSRSNKMEEVVAQILASFNIPYRQVHH